MYYEYHIYNPIAYLHCDTVMINGKKNKSPTCDAYKVSEDE